MRSRRAEAAPSSAVVHRDPPGEEARTGGRLAGYPVALGICALAVAINPLVFSHSLTFMTDVPFLAFVLLAILSFVHTVRSGSLTTAVLTVLLTLAATLTRQFGVVLPLLFLLACAVARTLTVRTMIVIVCAGLVAHGALRQYEGWLQSSGQMGPNYGVAMKELLALLRDPRALATRPLSIVDAIRIVLTYIGLFLLPPALAILPGRTRAAHKTFVLPAVALAGWFAWSTMGDFARRGWKLPFMTNFVLADFGIGPVNLTDVRVRNLGHFPTAGILFWQRATYVGLAGGGLVIVLVVLTALELLTRKTRGGPPREAHRGARARLRDELRPHRTRHSLRSVLHPAPPYPADCLPLGSGRRRRDVDAARVRGGRSSASSRKRASPSRRRTTTWRGIACAGRRSAT